MRRAARIDAPYLGTLCRRGHDHEGTGKSLRHAAGHCAACHKLRAAARLQDPEKAARADAARLVKQERRRVAANRPPRGKPLTLERRREISRLSKVKARRADPDGARLAAKERYAKHRVATCIRNRVYRAIKQQKTGKVQTVLGYGIDVQAIAAHLGPCPGMHGDWHIDHIKPLAWFDMSDPDQVRQAFRPENHQWLPARANLIKGARRHG